MNGRKSIDSSNTGRTKKQAAILPKALPNEPNGLLDLNSGAAYASCSIAAPGVLSAALMYGTPQLVHVRLCASWTHRDALSRSSPDAVKPNRTHPPSKHHRALSPRRDEAHRRVM